MTEVNSVPSMTWTKRAIADRFQRMVAERHRQIGDTIIRLREAREWSQEDLAHHAGVATKTIYRLENGRSDGRADTMRKLATALEVDLFSLVAPDLPQALIADPSQLDRIEAMLAELLTLVRPAEMPEEVAEEAARTRKAKRPAAGRSAKRPPNSGRAA